jgi:hypothetical protein
VHRIEVGRTAKAADGRKRENGEMWKKMKEK